MRVGLLVSGLLFAIACTPPPVRLNAPEKSVSADDYGDQLHQWTRSVEEYSTFESRIFAHATYLSAEFRRAQVTFRAATERLPKTDVVELSKDERERAAKSHDFFLAAHTHEWTWNHLEDRGKDALWRLRLINSKGESVAPTSIKRIGQRNHHYTALYSYYRDFYVAYLVRFPREVKGGTEILSNDVSAFTLRIGGPQAVIDLTWVVAK